MKVIKSKKGNTSCDLNIQSKISAQNLSCQMYAVNHLCAKYIAQTNAHSYLINSSE